MPIGGIYDRTKEHLGTSDAAVIAVRRRLIRAVRELAQGIEPVGAQHGDLWRSVPVDIELPKGVPFDEGAREWISGDRSMLRSLLKQSSSLRRGSSADTSGLKRPQSSSGLRP